MSAKTVPSMTPEQYAERFRRNVKAVLNGRGGTMGAVADGLTQLGLGKSAFDHAQPTR